MKSVSYTHLAIAQLDCEDGIVFLTDLLGGTPFRVASTLAMQKPGCEVDVYKRQLLARWRCLSGPLTAE